MRNIGGGVGISIVTTILSRRSQSHQAELVQHFTPYDYAFNRMLHNVQGALAPAMGTYASGQQAYATVYGMLVRQATLLSFLDVFRFLSVLSLIAVPCVFIFKKVKAKGGGMPGH